jgi:hypothetical protein
VKGLARHDSISYGGLNNVQYLPITEQIWYPNN